MKLFKKILASTLALLITGTFIFGANIGKEFVEINISYAASPIDEQREQLRLAIEDVTYVRGTESYKNAAKKDVKAYETAISEGENFLNNSSATGQELYQATKNIDSAAKYLPTSANIIIFKSSIEKLEKRIDGFRYIQEKMPNIYKKFKSEIDSIIKDSNNIIEKVNKYIAQYEK